MKPMIAKNIKVCQPIAIQDHFVNFRNLLLDPDMARGGSGKSPYDNNASHAMNFFRSIQLAVSNVTIENVDTIHVIPVNKGHVQIEYS